MKITESQLWKRISKECPDDIILQRDENIVGVGQPDVIGIKKGGFVFWLELKTAAKPVRKTSKVFKSGYVNPSQKLWFLKWTSLGANAFILLQMSHELYLMPGKPVIRDIDDLTVSDIEQYKVTNIFESLKDYLR